MSNTDSQDYKTKAKSLCKRHPILANIVLILLAAIVLGWLMLHFLDIWTIHGKNRIVPDVKGLSYERATEVLKKADLNVEISDSLYDDSTPAGTVVEQWPKEGAKVKPERLVYLKINAFYPKVVTITDDFTDVSLRQAISYLESLGIKQIRTVEIPGQYDDLVIAAKFNGLPLKIGSKLPVTATVTVEVSVAPHNSFDDFENDSIFADTDSINHQIIEE